MTAKQEPAHHWPAGYFDRSHPLAEVAQAQCQATHNLGRNRYRIACGPCWERAIRDDELVALAFGVPREIEPDPDYADRVAVELACEGKRVRLRPSDRRAAFARLRDSGMTPTDISRRLHLSYEAVTAMATSDSEAA